MKKLLLLLIILALAPAPALAQRDVVTVEVDPGETCPLGWDTTNTAWTKPAKIFYVLPPALVTASRSTNRWLYDTVEFEVTQTFVTALWPTLTEQQAAYASGRLRSEPATSGSVRTCRIGT